MAIPSVSSQRVSAIFFSDLACSPLTSGRSSADRTIATALRARWLLSYSLWQMPNFGGDRRRPGASASRLAILTYVGSASCPRAFQLSVQRHRAVDADASRREQLENRDDNWLNRGTSEPGVALGSPPEMDASRAGRRAVSEGNAPRGARRGPSSAYEVERAVAGCCCSSALFGGRGVLAADRGAPSWPTCCSLPRPLVRRGRARACAALCAGASGSFRQLISRSLLVLVGGGAPSASASRSPRCASGATCAYLCASSPRRPAVGFAFAPVPAAPRRSPELPSYGALRAPGRERRPAAVCNEIPCGRRAARRLRSALVGRRRSSRRVRAALVVGSA